MENDAISSLIFIETIESINQERKKKIPSHFPRRPLGEDEFRDRKRNTTRYWTRECKSMARNLTNSKKLRKRKRKKQEVDWKRKENRIEIALYVHRPEQEEWNTDESIDWRETREFCVKTSDAKERKKERKKRSIGIERYSNEGIMSADLIITKQTGTFFYPIPELFLLACDRGGGRKQRRRKIPHNVC